MARQEFKYNPLDFEPDVAVGVTYPFNGNSFGRGETQHYASGSVSGNPGVFGLSYSTEDQAVSNLKTLILTKKGERFMQPDFGTTLVDSLFEQNSEELVRRIQDGLNELKKISVEKNMTGWDKINKVMNTAYENLMKPETYPMIKMFFEARNGGEIQDVLLAGADASMEVKKSMLDNAYTQAQLNNFPTQEEKDVDLAYRKSLIPTKADEEAQKAITELNRATAELRRSQV